LHKVRATVLRVHQGKSRLPRRSYPQRVQA
jgi:hypothetical protein